MFNIYGLSLVMLLICIVGMIGGSIIWSVGEKYGLYMVIVSTVVSLLTTTAMATTRHVLKINGATEDECYNLTIIACYGIWALVFSLGIIELKNGNVGGRWAVASSIVPLLMVTCYTCFIDNNCFRFRPPLHNKPDKPEEKQSQQYEEASSGGSGSSSRRRPARLRRKRRAQSRRT